MHTTPKAPAARHSAIRALWHGTRFFLLGIATFILVYAVASWWGQDTPDRECTAARVQTPGGDRERRVRPTSGSYTIMRFGDGDSCWYYERPWGL